jgi:hypothetical protein
MVNSRPGKALKRHGIDDTLMVDPLNLARDSSFLDLPLKMKRQIYKELFTGVVIVAREAGLDEITAIFQTCHECYNEAKPIFIERVLFKLQNSNYYPRNKHEILGPPATSLTRLQDNLSHIDISRIKYLEICHIVAEKGDLPTIFPNLKSMTIVADAWVAINSLWLQQEELVHVLRNERLKEDCAEWVGSQVHNNAEGEGVENFPSFGTNNIFFAIAKKVLCERNESVKRYMIFLQASLLANLRMMDEDFCDRLVST